ncbi:hypothetical protein Glove_166g113 [Diversispora epigaea]|uniref:Uncharacterized protein n=1 Tax=Diversispora epigaea TaxID=1348612 RepID=A0A397IQP6_9GLOM|nr:hypothetical protein Glove_166g113 [Diversispora epigaea]
MVREEPGIKISYDTSSKTQPMPNFYFYFDKNFTIYCYFGIDGDECPDYYDYAYNESSYYPYYYSYEPKGQVSLSTSSDYFFEIYVDDDTFDSYNQSTPMYMQAIDIEYPYENKKPKFIDTIEVSNSYYLTQSNGTNLYFFEFYRLRREELDGSFFSLLGFNPTYEKYNYIESDLQLVVYNFVNGYGFYAKVPVTLKTPITEVEKEQRTRTILEVLANIAALYGVTLSTYVLLFGERATRPLLEKFMDPDGSKV